MQIDEKLLSKLENLAQLKIDEVKKDEVLNELNKFLEFVENLNELNLSNIESTKESCSPLRKDEAKSNEEIGKKILNNAPKSEDNFFIVPKIIE